MTRQQPVSAKGNRRTWRRLAAFPNPRPDCCFVVPVFFSKGTRSEASLDNAARSRHAALVETASGWLAMVLTGG